MVQIKKMQEEDIAAVLTIEESSFSKPWTREGFQSAIKRPEAVYLVAKGQGNENDRKEMKIGHKPIMGYAGMWVAADEGEITNVAVHPKHRGNGIGTQLLEKLLEYGKKAGVSVYYLEVRKSNQSAVRLYDRQGFERVGIRKNFYEAPTEDAIIMRKR